MEKVSAQLRGVLVEYSVCVSLKPLQVPYRKAIRELSQQNTLIAEVKELLLMLKLRQTPEPPRSIPGASPEQFVDTACVCGP